MLPDFTFTRWKWKEQSTRKSRKQDKDNKQRKQPTTTGNSLFTDHKWNNRRSRNAVNTVNTSNQEEATEQTFRRAFVGRENPSLENVNTARTLGLEGVFTFQGFAVFSDTKGERGRLIPHGGQGEQKGGLGEVLYQGNFEKGRRSGQGVSYRTNGSVEFEGIWKFDAFSDGKYYDNSNRLEYEGTFDRSNRPNGQGIFYFTDETQYQGEFVAGLFSGRGKRTQKNGKLIVEGIFDQGRLVKGTTRTDLVLPLNNSELYEDSDSISLSSSSISSIDEQSSLASSRSNNSSQEEDLVDLEDNKNPIAVDDVSKEATESLLDLVEENVSGTSALLDVLASSSENSESENSERDKDDSSALATAALIGALTTTTIQRKRCELKTNDKGECFKGGRPGHKDEFSHPLDDDWETAIKPEEIKKWICKNCNTSNPMSYNFCGKCQQPGGNDDDDAIEDEKNEGALATAALMGALGNELSAEATSTLLGLLGESVEEEDDNDEELEKITPNPPSSPQHQVAVSLINTVLKIATSPPPKSPQHQAAVEIVDFVLKRATSPLPTQLKFNFSEDENEDVEHENDSSISSSDDSDDSDDSSEEEEEFDEKEIALITKLQNLIRSFLLRLVEKEFLEFLQIEKRKKESWLGNNNEKKRNELLLNTKEISKDDEEERKMHTAGKDDSDGGNNDGGNSASVSRIDESNTFAYAGSYFNGLPHSVENGEKGTYKFYQNLKEILVSKYKGRIINGQMNGNGTMHYVLHDEIWVKGIWENGDPRNNQTHVCYGTMYNLKTTKTKKKNEKKKLYYGRSTNGIKNGLGIKFNSKSKHNKHQVGRWWFGRQCGCNRNKRGVVVEDTTFNMTCTFPIVNSTNVYQKQEEYNVGNIEDLREEDDEWLENDDEKIDYDTASIASSKASSKASSTTSRTTSRTTSHTASSTTSNTFYGIKSNRIPIPTVTILLDNKQLNDGTSYRGSLLHGKTPCGKGTLVIPRGVHQLNPIARVYEGHFEKGVPTTGETNFENGDVYIGEHDLYGRPHGNGTMTYGGCDHHHQLQQNKQPTTPCPKFCNGPLRYSGSFVNGELHGKGTLEFMNGNKYVGEFYYSTMAGLGMLYYYDGKIVKGFYHLAKPLHLSSAIVDPGTIHGHGIDQIYGEYNYTYLGKIKGGQPHGMGKKTIRVQIPHTSRKAIPDSISKRTMIQEGDFHYGIYIVPAKKWMHEFVTINLLDIIYPTIEERELEKAEVAKESISATAALLDLVDEDGDADGDADVVEESEEATSALLNLAEEEEEEEEEEVDSNSANATNALMGVMLSNGENDMNTPVDAKIASKLTQKASESFKNVLKEEEEEDQEDKEMNIPVTKAIAKQLTQQGTNAMLMASRVVAQDSSDDDSDGSENMEEEDVEDSLMKVAAQLDSSDDDI